MLYYATSTHLQFSARIFMGSSISITWIIPIFIVHMKIGIFEKVCKRCRINDSFNWFKSFLKYFFSTVSSTYFNYCWFYKTVSINYFYCLLVDVLCNIINNRRWLFHREIIGSRSCGKGKRLERSTWKSWTFTCNPILRASVPFTRSGVQENKEAAVYEDELHGLIRLLPTD